MRQQYQRVGNTAARQRRMELLSHPLAVVRVALEPTTKLGNLRRQGNVQLVEYSLYSQGDKLTLAADADKPAPTWISYVAQREPRRRDAPRGVRRIRA